MICEASDSMIRAMATPGFRVKMTQPPISTDKHRLKIITPCGILQAQNARADFLKRGGGRVSLRVEMHNVVCPAAHDDL